MALVAKFGHTISYILDDTALISLEWDGIIMKVVATETTQDFSMNDLKSGLKDIQQWLKILKLDLGAPLPLLKFETEAKVAAGIDESIHSFSFEADGLTAEWEYSDDVFKLVLKHMETKYEAFNQYIQSLQLWFDRTEQKKIYG